MKTDAQQVGNYNVDLALWQSACKAYRNYPHGGPRLTLYDGMIGDGYQVLARFNDDAAAIEMLTEAGFVRQSDNTWKASPAPCNS